MTFKKINFLKVSALIGLSLILVWVAFCSLKKVNHNKIQKTETFIKDEQIEPNLTLRDSIVSFSKELLGTPYVSASCSRKGFDCSGFVYYVFQHFNINVPRSSSGYENFGEEIPIDNVQKGDVLVFLSPSRNEIGHVGIVSKANGKESDFIHATSGKEMKVVITSLKNKGYTRRFVKAVSVL